MGIFDTILTTLGLKPKPSATTAQPAAAAQPKPSAQAVQPKPKPSVTPVAHASVQAQTAAAAGAAGIASVKPAAMPMVDVVSKLDALAKESGLPLDWKVSIVDLMKLLKIDSSLDARKDLAKELGCPADQMNDSARMNVWLHKTVMQKLAENGGNIPKDLLD